MPAMGTVLTELCHCSQTSAHSIWQQQQAGRLQLTLRCQATCDANTPMISGLLTQQQILRI